MFFIVHTLMLCLILCLEEEGSINWYYQERVGLRKKQLQGRLSSPYKSKVLNSQEKRIPCKSRLGMKK